MHADAAEGRGHGCHRGDEMRPAGRRAAGDHTTQAMPYKMHLPAGFLVGAVDRLAEAHRQHFRAVRVPADARKVRLVTDPAEPAVHIAQVLIGAHKAGDYKDG